jgi:three-Cys-motif partner protein
MWKCASCGCSREEKPTSCPECGLVQAGLWTDQKYEILNDYCHPLSHIMRNQGIKHYFIDACAGSGVIQDQSDIIDGSPLIMAKTPEYVQNKIKNKTKEPSVECIFIEINTKTYSHLCKSLDKYRNFVQTTNADANSILISTLDKLQSAFTFVYIDPFGLGDPVIKYETIKHVLERRFTELFLHFSWEGVSRTAGLLSNIDHHDQTLQKQARSAIATLNLFMGGDIWQEIWRRKMEPSVKRKSILDLYLNGLKTYYDFPTPIEIPLNSRDPDFYLVFTTRNETGNKIMNDIVNRKRRKGSAKMEDFFK